MQLVRTKYYEVSSMVEIKKKGRKKMDVIQERRECNGWKQESESSGSFYFHMHFSNVLEVRNWVYMKCRFKKKSRQLELVFDSSQVKCDVTIKCRFF